MAVFTPLNVMLTWATLEGACSAGMFLLYQPRLPGSVVSCNMVPDCLEHFLTGGIV